MSDQITVSNDSIFDPSPELIDRAIAALEIYCEIDLTDDNHLGTLAVLSNHNAGYESRYPANLIVRTDEAEIVGAALSAASYSEMRCDFESGEYDLEGWIEDREKVETYFLEGTNPYYYDEGNVTLLSEWVRENLPADEMSCWPDEGDIARNRSVALALLRQLQERIISSVKS